MADINAYLREEANHVRHRPSRQRISPASHEH